MLQSNSFPCPACTQQISEHKVQRMLKLQEFAQKNIAVFNKLTRREREILSLVGTGWTNLEIATKLFISVDAVRTHRNNIFRKLNIRSAVRAARWAAAFDLT